MPKVETTKTSKTSRVSVSRHLLMYFSRC